MPLGDGGEAVVHLLWGGRAAFIMAATSRMIVIIASNLPNSPKPSMPVTQIKPGIRVTDHLVNNFGGSAQVGLWVKILDPVTSLADVTDGIRKRRLSQ